MRCTCAPRRSSAISNGRAPSWRSTHAQLLGLLELMTALWREHAAGAARAGAGAWNVVEELTRGWAAHNELGRVLRQIGEYYRS